MKQKRKLKFSLGMKIASLLACIAVVSVGFASWWILKPIEPKELADVGSFEVYGANIKGITISFAEADVTNPEIIFGRKANHTPTYTWLTWDQANPVKDEQLTSTFDFKVAADTAGDNIDELIENVVITLTPSNASNFASAVNDGYIVPTLKYGTYTADLANGVFTLTIPKEAFADVNSKDFENVTFSFTWGSKFGTNNPYEYYGGMKADADIDIGNSQTQKAWEHAAEHLAKLNEYLTGMTYTINITATAKPAAN